MWRRRDNKNLGNPTPQNCVWEPRAHTSNGKPERCSRSCYYWRVKSREWEEGKPVELTRLTTSPRLTVFFPCDSAGRENRFHEEFLSFALRFVLSKIKNDREMLLSGNFDWVWMEILKGETPRLIRNLKTIKGRNCGKKLIEMEFSGNF